MGGALVNEINSILILMTLEIQLMEAVSEGRVEDANALIKEGADFRHDNDAGLRLAAVNGDDKMRNLLLWCYRDRTVLEEVTDAIAEDLIAKANALRLRSREIIAARVMKESAPPIEL
jgi:hypothetical protein